MALPRLPLPDSPYTAAFRQVVQELRDGAFLQRLGVTLRVYDGQSPSNDVAPFADVQAPAIRVTPTAEAGAWENEGQHASGLNLKLETLTKGTNADDAMNLWWALVRTLYPGDQSVFGRISAVVQGTEPPGSALISYTIAQPTFTPVGVDDGVALMGEGMIRVRLLVTTRY